MTKSVEQKKEELTHKTFVLMFRILLIFGIPAALAFFLGRWIDTTYDMRPYGTLGVLVLAFASSWAWVIQIYRKLTREFQALREEEEKQRNDYQDNLTDR